MSVQNSLNNSPAVVNLKDDLNRLAGGVETQGEIPAARWLDELPASGTASRNDAIRTDNRGTPKTIDSGSKEASPETKALLANILIGAYTTFTAEEDSSAANASNSTHIRTILDGMAQPPAEKTIATTASSGNGGEPTIDIHISGNPMKLAEAVRQLKTILASSTASDQPMPAIAGMVPNNGVGQPGNVVWPATPGQPFNNGVSQQNFVQNPRYIPNNYPPPGGYPPPGYRPGGMGFHNSPMSLALGMGSIAAAGRGNNPAATELAMASMLTGNNGGYYPGGGGGYYPGGGGGGYYPGGGGGYYPGGGGGGYYPGDGGYYPGGGGGYYPGGGGGYYPGGGGGYGFGNNLLYMGANIADTLILSSLYNNGGLGGGGLGGGGTGGGTTGGGGLAQETNHHFVVQPTVQPTVHPDQHPIVPIPTPTPNPHPTPHPQPHPHPHPHPRVIPGPNVRPDIPPRPGH